MKLTHEHQVESYRKNGYTEVDIYPAIPLTILTDGRKFVTIKGIRVRDGYHKPKN